MASNVATLAGRALGLDPKMQGLYCSPVRKNAACRGMRLEVDVGYVPKIKRSSAEDSPLAKGSGPEFDP